MTEAYICDFTRTPIGRYAGALRDVRTDDLAAHPIKALMARNAQVDWEALDDCILGCANQAGEDNRNVARMAVLLSGLPANVPGAHDQPAVRLRAGCGRHRGARHPCRRGRADAGRRRGKHDARAVRDGQGDRGVLAQQRGLRHDDRLALRQCADAEGLRHRCDAGDRRERRRGIPDLAPGSGQVRLSQPDARSEGAEQRVLREGDHAGHDQGPQGRYRGGQG